MFRIQLRTKLILVVIFTTTVSFAAVLLFYNKQLKKLSREQAIALASSNAEEHAATCKNYLDIDLGYTKALADAASGFEELPRHQRDSAFKAVYLRMIKKNPKFVAVWNTIELQYTDTNYPYDYGRKSIAAVKSGMEYNVVEFYRDMDGHNTNGNYYRMKKDNIVAVTDPYVDPEVGNFLITSTTAPIRIGGAFAGQAGIDFRIDVFQNFIDSLYIMDGATSMVISNSGILLGHSNPELVGSNITDIMASLNIQEDFVSIIQSGNPKGFEHKIDEKPYYTAIVPFYVENTNTPWAFSITLPINPFLEGAMALSKNIFWIGLFGILFVIFVVWINASKIVKPLKDTTRVFKELATGNINDNLKLLNINTKDEIQDMASSVNQLIDNLQKTEKFAREIEKGNLLAQYDTRGDNDRLGNALLNMRQGLLDAKEKDEKRHEEDKIRNWTLDGLAKLSDVLHQDNDNFGEYMQNIINYIVRYTETNQGGIYIVNNTGKNRKVELIGSYGFDGEKFNRKNFEYEEGLIGMCIKERKTTYIEELPKNYLKINSGLGGNVPGSLIISPLKYNDRVLGVIEIASLKKMEGFKKQFIEEVAEDIALTIDSLRIQQESHQLLERTQVQAEQMQAQEEELRQNMEELMATQEENSRSMKKMQKDLKSAHSEIEKYKRR